MVIIYLERSQEEGVIMAQNKTRYFRKYYKRAGCNE